MNCPECSSSHTYLAGVRDGFPVLTEKYLDQHKKDGKRMFCTRCKMFFEAILVK